MKQTIKVQIPFQGFYTTIHEDQFDRFIEFEVLHMVDEGQFDDPLVVVDAVVDAIDWQKARQKYAEAYVTGLFTIIEEEFGFYPEYKNVTVRSPREYNFENDKIEVEMEVKDWLRLHDLVDTDQLARSVEEELKPRSGFIPLYSNDILDWKQPSEWEFPQTGLLLEVLLEQVVEDFEQGICYDISIYELMDDCVDCEKLEDLCGMNWEGRLTSEVDQVEL